MKLRFCLMLSLAGNLLLGWVVFRAGRTRPPVHAPTPMAPAVSTTAASAPPGFVTNKVPVVIEMPAPVRWAEIESTNYHDYIRNLRAIGCPENTVRDVVVAEMNELFSEKIANMVDAVSGRFWELVLKRQELERLAQEKAKDLQTIDRSRSEMLSALFNDSAVDTKRVNDWRAIIQEDESRLFLDFLPADKAGKVAEMQDQNEKARGRLRSLPEAEREEQQRRIAEREKEMEALLTAEELAEYRLRTALTADMRYTLGDLDVSTEDLKAMVGAAAGSDPDAIRNLLGPERYAQYERATNSMYQGVLAITDRFDLPAETAARVYEIRRAAEARAAEARASDFGTDPASMAAVLAELKEGAERRIAAELGPEAFKIYKRRAGEWLGATPDATR